MNVLYQLLTPQHQLMSINNITGIPKSLTRVYYHASINYDVKESLLEVEVPRSKPLLL